MTVEKRTKTGVRLPASANSDAAVYFFKRFVAFEITVCGRTAGMNYALRYTLMIKMGDLLAQNKILK